MNITDMDPTRIQDAQTPLFEQRAERERRAREPKRRPIMYDHVIESVGFFAIAAMNNVATPIVMIA